MNVFNVIIYDINRCIFKPYDVMPYFRKQYEELENKTLEFKDLKILINNWAMYQFWARCEYEIILSDWPSQKNEEKWDIYQQIQMNIDIITKLLIEDISKNSET